MPYTMTSWYRPMQSQPFICGVIALLILAFFLMWAVNNHGPQVWLCIIIAMLAIGSLQAAYVLICLCLEQPAARPLAMNIPMVELESQDSSDDDEHDNEH